MTGERSKLHKLIVKTLPDILKFRGIEDVVAGFRTQFLDLSLRFQDAIPGWRVGQE